MSFVVFKGQGCMACGIYKGLGFTGLKGGDPPKPYFWLS